MRPLLCLPALLMVLSRSHADFPAPKDLPSRPELPDPLVMMDGTKVTTKEQWTDKRRPELKALFQHYMYGTMPPPTSVKAKVLHQDPKAFGGKATLREVALTAFPGHEFRLLVVVPNSRKGPAPCFVGPNFSGNHSLVDDAKVALPDGWMYPNRAGVKDNKASDAGRGTQKDVWNLEQSVDRGYAVATFYNGDIDPDRAEVRGGIRPLLPRDLATATIACWAWGIHRAVDYLATLKGEIDTRRIAAVGHSRLGKTTLLAAAFDERIAMAIPLQAGTGGSAPSRPIGSQASKAESVKRINTSFPHWFNAAFKEFNEDPSQLPFDQNCLVALCAPRPVLFSNAVEDLWANPEGQFEVLKAAEPVYRLLGAGGLDAKAVPPLGKLVDSRLGYFVRAGKHSMTREDWEAFWAFADKHFGKP
ncbi:MAG TPA: acetylxylan esterase [Gemmataceae bacterium]|nr:acetylxylan esterase [Gemmataceae bacterium]